MQVGLKQAESRLGTTLEQVLNWELGWELFSGTGLGTVQELDSKKLHGLGALLWNWTGH